MMLDPKSIKILAKIKVFLCFSSLSIQGREAWASTRVAGLFLSFIFTLPLLKDIANIFDHIFKILQFGVSVSFLFY